MLPVLLELSETLSQIYYQQSYRGHSDLFVSSKAVGLLSFQGAAAVKRIQGKCIGWKLTIELFYLRLAVRVFVWKITLLDAIPYPADALE